MNHKAPEQLFEELFEDLHMSGLWDDGKFISDAIPKYKPEIILDKYRKHKGDEGFDLKVFFEENFNPDENASANFSSDTSKDVREHIEDLWTVLSRASFEPVEGSSALSIPFPYIVPGGRFNEIYYWDSYFTMLGLKVSGKYEMIENMIRNFAFMIDRFGFIPNGNRSYFLSRSQPPFFSLMVELLDTINDEDILLQYRAQLMREYQFWMHGVEENLQHRQSFKHVVRIGDSFLNRYYDTGESPRPEMYGADVHLFRDSGREAASLYANIRAACESGWDFSSRWLDHSLDLATIHCCDILPVDQNCLLYKLEKVISRSFALAGESDKAEEYDLKARTRAELIRQYFWDDEKGFFMDYHFRNDHRCKVLSLAGVFPLFFKIASRQQAHAVSQVLEREFLKDGGLVTTPVHSGQQWDAPNAWAPLQWIAIKGLRNYGFDDLANTVKKRWTKLNIKVYKETGKLLEKYNVEDINLPSGGGEYPVQDGFGWTNGVLLALLDE